MSGLSCLLVWYLLLLVLRQLDPLVFLFLLCCFGSDPWWFSIGCYWLCVFGKCLSSFRIYNCFSIFLIHSIHILEAIKYRRSNIYFFYIFEYSFFIINKIYFIKICYITVKCFIINNQRRHNIINNVYLRIFRLFCRRLISENDKRQIFSNFFLLLVVSKYKYNWFFN